MTEHPIVLEITGVADEGRIEALVHTTLELESKTLDRVTVSFIDGATMTGLNQAHRGKPHPTDVLSFPFDDSFPQGSGGEVVVCPEQADPDQRGAVDRLVVHGVLHLLGYEDETDAGLADMERRTDRIMGALDG